MDYYEMKFHKEVLRTLVRDMSKTEYKQWTLIRNNILMYKNRVLLKSWLENRPLTLSEIDELTEHLFYGMVKE